MRAAPVALLALAFLFPAPPASALSCVDTTGWAAWLAVHDVEADATVAVIGLGRPSGGSVCGVGNPHALSADRLAWVEPPVAWTSPDDRPWTLHVETLSSGERSFLGLPSGRPRSLSLFGDRVLVAMQGPFFVVADLVDGIVVPVTGDLPEWHDFALEGPWMEWPQRQGDGYVLRCRDATRDGPADQAPLALPSASDFLRVAAANERWLVLVHGDPEAPGGWAYERATDRATPLPGSPLEVEHELDGDVLYVQDDAGWRHMGRGDYHAVLLPDGARQRLPWRWPFEPADGLDVDAGRIVLRGTDREETPPQPPRPMPVASGAGARSPPCAGDLPVVAIPGAGGAMVLAVVCAMARLSRRAGP